MFENLKEIEISQLKPLKNQLGGHGLSPKGDIKFFFEISGGFILKRQKKYSRGYQEADFYEEILKSTNICLKKLTTFFPKYHGIYDNIDPTDKFICLENLFSSFTSPTSVDIKIGLLNKDKYKVADEVRFQICGMRVYHSDDDYYCIDKEKGKSLVQDTLKEELQTFFSRDYNFESENRIKIITKLREILQLLSQQNTWHFKSSSIIIAYENENIEKEKRNVVKMIDFSHASPANTTDLYTVSGLTNLIQYISTLFGSNF